MKNLILAASIAVFLGAVPGRAEFRQIDITTFGMD